MKEGRGEVVIEDGGGVGGRDEAKGLGSFLLGIDVNKGNGDEEQALEIIDANGNGALNLGEEKGGSNGEVVGDEKASENGKNEEFGVDGGDEYSVGDFVWGKIKSHPWWPGQIYDASDASDYAMKLKPEGKLLVAYFGDGTFAWCHPSQLRPFGENFEEMAKQSSSRNFAAAVDAAVDEIGRIIGLKMTCPCVPIEIRAELKKPFAVNGGVKENVLVPDVALEKLHVPWTHQLSELLTNLKVEAREPGASGLLDIVVLKSWVLAFYRSKGIYHLCSYPEPRIIEGLEDQKEDAVGKILNKGGPEDEDWLNPKPLSEKTKKKKSMAEILEGQGKSKGTAPSKKFNQRTRPKRRRVAKLIESTPVTESVDSGTDEENDSGAEKEEDYKEYAEESDLRVETSDDGEAKDPKGFYVSRERKKSKYLCPPYTTPPLKVSVVLSSDSNIEASPKPKPKPDLKHEASAKDVLSEIKSLKIDPSFSRKTESFPVVEEFLHMFRSSVFSDEESEGGLVVSGKRRKKSNNSETEPREKKIKKMETEKDGDLGGVRLLISFGPGSSLPSKEDLINIYGKFGPLDETETKMYYNNFCGVVAFQRHSDAESALTRSKDSSPFGTSNASFVLQPPSPKKKPKSRKKPSEVEKKKFEFEFVKEKIKSLSSMLENSKGKLSKEMRSRLESDLKGLLEKVSTGAVRGGGGESSAT